MDVNRITILLIIISALSGIGAIYFSNHYINSEVKQQKQLLLNKYSPVKLIVAKSEIRRGDILGYDNLAVREMPSDYIHSSAIKAEDSESLLGRKVTQNISEGEAILASFLAVRSAAGFSNLIDDGKRAVTFPVDIVSSMSGLLRPGDNIDLLLTLQEDDQLITKALIENVSILATGEIVDEEGRISENGTYQTITFAVAPIDAAKVTHARSAGTLTVVLRPSNGEKAGSESIGSITTDVLMGKEQVKPDVERKVEMIIGG